MIECRNITKTYINGSVKTHVLKGINFTIEYGEYVAIIGPSGSGKSTLMNILGLLDKPTSGEYIFEDKCTNKLNDDEITDLRKNKIGFVFQSFNLLSRATVLKNTMLPLIYNKTISSQTREKITKIALKSSGLEENLFNNLSNQLSGGQMQRVAIARSLVNNPSIILADEPTGNLDSKTGKIIIETFENLHRQGRTIIMITHDSHIAKNAIRTITIKDGLIESDRKNR